MSELEVIEVKQKEQEEEEKRQLAAQDLGQAVKRRVKELRWVQQDLADELNTSQSVISGIIAGTYLLTFDLVTRIANALRLSPLYLASYYWKEEEETIASHNDHVLERIRELLTEYYQIGGHQPHDEPTPPPYTRPPDQQRDIDASVKKMRRKSQKKKQPELNEPKPPEPDSENTTE